MLPVPACYAFARQLGSLAVQAGQQLRSAADAPIRRAGKQEPFNVSMCQCVGSYWSQVLLATQLVVAIFSQNNCLNDSAQVVKGSDSSDSNC